MDVTVYVEKYYGHDKNEWEQMDIVASAVSGKIINDYGTDFAV